MLTVAAIVSLRNLPLSAEFGLSSVFYFVIAAIGFFVPIALVTAELATGWPKSGGSYAWVSEAFGKNCGFFALWMGWMESIAWFPAILAFTAAMLAHLLHPIFPALEHNKIFYFIIMQIVFWGFTFLNFLGIQTSGWISALGVITGTLIPGALIISLGLWWIANGHPSHIEFSWNALVPDFRLDSMVFYSGILFALAGVELAAFHIREARNPQRDYPRALVIATVIIFLVSILGTLAIAIVVPQKDISLISGLIQAFTVFFSAFDMPWVVPLIALFAFIGALAGINTWIIGPAKGLLVTAEDGFLPPFLKRVNSRGVSIGTLMFQAVVGTFLSLVFLWMDDHSAAFWILTALSAQFTVVQYAFMLLAVLRLRYSQPHVFRAYRVPGGWMGLWLVVLLGIFSCVFGFLIVFIPPSQLKTPDQNIYQSMLIISLIALSIPPILLTQYRKREIKKS